MVYRMYRIQKERRKMTDFAECSMAMQDFLMILLEICLILQRWWYCCFIFAGQSGERDADIIILCLTGL